MSRSSFKPAAGVVVLRHMDGDWNVLCLKTHNGGLDLTKGIIDDHEDAFETALRETKEEASITELTFPFGKEPISHDACTMYVGVTEQEAEIQTNPHSGIREHADYVWMPIIDAVNSDKIKGFLMPSILYAFDLVRSHSS